MDKKKRRTCAVVGIATRVLDGAIVTSLGLDVVFLHLSVSLESNDETIIDEIGVRVRLEHYVGALYVAVRVSTRVNVLECVDDLPHEAQHSNLVYLVRWRLVDQRLHISHVSVHHQEPVLLLVVRALARRDVPRYAQVS